MFGPLPIRILAGILFIVHGLPKFEDVTSNQDFFGSVGIPPELVVPIGLLEVIGGIFLLVGVVTRITATFHNRDDKCNSYRQAIERVCRRVRTRIAVSGYRYKPTLDRSRKNIY